MSSLPKFAKYFLANALFALLLFSCSARQQNLAIQLAETPLYSPKQWAVVKIPYIKINQQIHLSESLLGMVRLGDIVEVERIEQSPEDKTMWAFILKDSTLQGWIPYGFLHMVDNYVEGELISHQISKPNQIFLDSEKSDNELLNK